MLTKTRRLWERDYLISTKNHVARYAGGNAGSRDETNFNLTCPVPGDADMNREKVILRGLKTTV